MHDIGASFLCSAFHSLLFFIVASFLLNVRNRFLLYFAVLAF